jgi:hypothetical protein
MRWVALIALGSALIVIAAACSIGAPAASAPASPGLSPIAVLPASPASHPSPALTPEPATPSPSPTSTPDPWADKFFTGGPAYLSVKDAINGPWIYKNAGLSVEVRCLRGGPQDKSYYLADIYSRGPLPFGGFAYQSDRGKTEMPYRIARRYQAVLGLTADYFNYRLNKKGVIIMNGVVYADKKKNTTLAILPDGSLKAYEPGEIDADTLLKMGVQNAFSFGPILVKGGVVDSQSIKDHWLSSRAYEYRASIGQDVPGHYIVIVTRGGFTMSQLAQLFVDRHCTLAYMMDGGHSACMIFMGEQLNQQYPGSVDGVCQRPLPDLMMIGSDAAVPGVKDKVFCNGVHMYTKNKPKPTDGIIQ